MSSDYACPVCQRVFAKLRTLETHAATCQDFDDGNGKKKKRQRKNAAIGTDPSLLASSTTAGAPSPMSKLSAKQIKRETKAAAPAHERRPKPSEKTREMWRKQSKLLYKYFEDAVTQTVKKST
jgi:hypothetical protein